MIKADLHTHSIFSFDGERSGDAYTLALAARCAGLDYIAITDHYDVNFQFEEKQEKYKAQEARQSVMNAKENAKGIYVAYGIELGQITQYPDKALDFLASNPFEVVIGSLHNIRGEEDFYFLDPRTLSQADKQELFDRYLDEYLEMLSFKVFDIAAHLTYPIRYMGKTDVSALYKQSEGKIRKIFEKIIGSGICLEVNTAKMDTEFAASSPDSTLLEIYKEMGGERITIGSDAHAPDRVGANFACAEKMLLQLGFDSCCYIKNKTVYEQKFCK